MTFKSGLTQLWMGWLWHTDIVRSQWKDFAFYFVSLLGRGNSYQLAFPQTTQVMFGGRGADQIIQAPKMHANIMLCMFVGFVSTSFPFGQCFNVAKMWFQLHWNFYPKGIQNFVQRSIEFSVLVLYIIHNRLLALISKKLRRVTTPLVVAVWQNKWSVNKIIVLTKTFNSFG